MGRKPLLIEILTKIDGVSFEEAAHGAIEVELVGMRIRVIGKDAPLKNKRASRRAKDLSDLEALESTRS